MIAGVTSAFALASSLAAPAAALSGGEPEPPVGIAAQVVKVQLRRNFDRAGEEDRAAKVIEDKARVRDPVALFPEAGTDRKPEVA